MAILAFGVFIVALIVGLILSGRDSEPASRSGSVGSVAEVQAQPVDTDEVPGPAGSSAGLVAGFGLFSVWIVAMAVGLTRAQRRQRRREASLEST